MIHLLKLWVILQPGNYNFYTITVLTTFCLSASLAFYSLPFLQPRVWPTKKPQKGAYALAVLLFVRNAGNTAVNTVQFFQQIWKFFQGQAQREKSFNNPLDFIWLKQFVPVPTDLVSSRPGLWVWRGCSHLSPSPHFAFFSLGCCSAVHRHRVGARAGLQREIPARPDTVNLEFVGPGNALGLRPC